MQVIHNIPSYQKIEPYGSTSDYNVTVAGGSNVAIRAAAGETLDYIFPKGFIDLSSLHMLFRYRCLPFVVSLGGTSQALPRDSECLIDTLEVYLGNKRVNYITNYGQIFNLLSTHAWGGDHQTYRSSYQNNWVNGRISLTTNLDGTQFCFQKWLGLLGLPVVLDTEKLGQLHVKITLAPSFVTTSNNANHSWGIYDTYMKVRYYSNYKGDLPRYLEWDDYKTLYDTPPLRNSTATLKVFSSKIDWALLKLLRSDGRLKSNVLDGNINTTFTFGSPHNWWGTWNIAVNNQNIFKYKATTADALLALQDIFEKETANYGLVAGNNSQAFDRCTYLGAKIGFINEIPEETEISITLENGQTTMFTCMIVKTTSSLEMKGDGSVIHKV